ncbi:MAG TPA: glycine cleavage system protein GcvH [Spirochaetota bacterium]|nr:glycine cleavage system protein GcvH [Spirochaetota bacterium]
MKYTESHEWVDVDEDNIATVGITDHAQQQLSDIVYVELPETGDSVSAKESFMTIESVKAASDIYAPVSGEITEVNSALEDAPETINQSPEKDGWLVKIKLNNPQELDGLLNEEGYNKLNS